MQVNDCCQNELSQTSIREFSQPGQSAEGKKTAKMMYNFYTQLITFLSKNPQLRQQLIDLNLSIIQFIKNKLKINIPSKLSIVKITLILLVFRMMMNSDRQRQIAQHLFRFIKKSQKGQQKKFLKKPYTQQDKQRMRNFFDNMRQLLQISFGVEIQFILPRLIQLSQKIFIADEDIQNEGSFSYQQIKITQYKGIIDDYFNKLSQNQLQQVRQIEQNQHQQLEMQESSIQQLENELRFFNLEDPPSQIQEESPSHFLINNGLVLFGVQDFERNTIFFD